MSDAERALAEAEEAKLRIMERRLADLYRASGLRESRTRMEAEAASLEDQIEKEEEALKQVEGAKRAYELAAGERLSKRVLPFLPDGKVEVEFDEKGAARIFWRREAKTPARSLSGGEKAVFIPALAAAWANDESSAVVTMEGGEVDSNWLESTVKSMVDGRPENVQFLVLSWHLPDGVDEKNVQVIQIDKGED